LALFIAIDNEGRSVVVFYGLILSLKNENIEWLFKKVKAAFEIYNLPLPKVIMSDDGKTVTPNIKKYFSTAKNQLCAWHISQNFSKKIQNPKIKFLASRLPYESNMARTNELIQRILDDPSISAKDLKYFKKKLLTVASWSVAFQNEHQNLGINTTSRIESINSKFKRFLNPNCRLLELQYFIDRVNETKKNLLKPTNRRFFFAKQPPKMKMLQEVYSNYIFEPLE